jgi:hypothetical protein
MGIAKSMACIRAADKEGSSIGIMVGRRGPNATQGKAASDWLLAFVICTETARASLRLPILLSIVFGRLHPSCYIFAPETKC